MEIPDVAGEAVGQPLERRNRRARPTQVVDVGVGSAHGGGAGSSSMCARRTARGEGAGGGFDGVVAWLVAVPDEDLFRNIVGFL